MTHRAHAPATADSARESWKTDQAAQLTMLEDLEKRRGYIPHRVGDEIGRVLEIRLERLRRFQSRLESSVRRDVQTQVARWRPEESNLILLLHAIQNQHGYVPREVAMKLSRRLVVKLARIHDVMTSYHEFRLHPPGRHNVIMCNSTASCLRDAAAGLPGRGIPGSGFSFDATVRLGAGALAYGEETALIASIEGRRGGPSPRRPHPSVRGLRGKPTSINHVETLANESAILLRGGAWQAGRGVESSRGTTVFAVAGTVKHVQLVERCRCDRTDRATRCADPRVIPHRSRTTRARGRDPREPGSALRPPTRGGVAVVPRQRHGALWPGRVSHLPGAAARGLEPCQPRGAERLGRHLPDRGRDLARCAALTTAQLACVVWILAGVTIGLAPRGVPTLHAAAARRGAARATLSALAPGCGAVLSRRPFIAGRESGPPVDPGTATFERAAGEPAIGAIVWVPIF